MIDSLNKPLKIVGVLASIILILIAIRAAYAYVYYTWPPKQVNISVSYSPNTKCRAETPIYMLITNDSFREITSTSFGLAVRERNNSDNLVPLLARGYSTGKVIKSGSSYGACWEYPELATDDYDPKDLTYGVTRQQIAFRD